jgi:hypothetical protein
VFNGSGLKSIRIPSSVEIIGEWCFHACRRSLYEVTFEGGIAEVGKCAFDECMGLRCVRIPGGGKLTCKLPGDCVIEYCDLVVEEMENRFQT